MRIYFTSSHISAGLTEYSVFRLSQDNTPGENYLEYNVGQIYETGGSRYTRVIGMGGEVSDHIPENPEEGEILPLFGLHYHEGAWYFKLDI
jgi:hypothetical protein